MYAFVEASLFRFLKVLKNIFNQARLILYLISMLVTKGN